jgi:hypothetical protein
MSKEDLINELQAGITDTHVTLYLSSLTRNQVLALERFFGKDFSKNIQIEPVIVPEKPMINIQRIMQQGHQM